MPAAVATINDTACNINAINAPLFAMENQIANAIETFTPPSSASVKENTITPNNPKASVAIARRRD